MLLSVLVCLPGLLSAAPLPLPTDSVRRHGADSLVIIRTVNLRGNDRTRSRIITREMELRPGDTVRAAQLPQELAWDQRKISNTNLFITVDVVARNAKTGHVVATATTLANQTADAPPLRSDNPPPGAAPVPDSLPPVTTFVDVDVVMKERWYLFAYPVFDIADRNLNEWWYERGRDLRRTIYGARLSYRNVTGANDRLGLIAEFGFVQRTVLTYARPYLDRAQRTGLRVDVSYATNREFPYRSAADKWVFFRADEIIRRRLFVSGQLSRRNGFYHFHFLEGRYNRNVIADTVAARNPDYFLDGRTRQRYVQLSYTYRYDRRDNVAYPLRGTLLNLTALQLGVLPTDDLHQTELLGNVSHSWPLGGRFYASALGRFKVSWPDRQPYHNLRGLGNVQELVRGYELYVIDGQRFALLRSNLRYQLFNVVKQLRWVPVRQFNTLPVAAYPTFFADAGYVRSTVAEQYQSRLANRPLVGTGLSLDVVTFYNMVGRFSFAVNGLGQPGFFVTLTQEL